jgi:hypothetical protein
MSTEDEYQIKLLRDLYNSPINLCIRILKSCTNYQKYRIKIFLENINNNPNYLDSIKDFIRIAKYHYDIYKQFIHDNRLHSLSKEWNIDIKIGTKNIYVKLRYLLIILACHNEYGQLEICIKICNELSITSAKIQKAICTVCNLPDGQIKKLFKSYKVIQQNIVLNFFKNSSSTYILKSVMLMLHKNPTLFYDIYNKLNNNKDWFEDVELSIDKLLCQKKNILLIFAESFGSGTIKNCELICEEILQKYLLKKENSSIFISNMEETNIKNDSGFDETTYTEPKMSSLASSSSVSSLHSIDNDEKLERDLYLLYTKTNEQLAFPIQQISLGMLYYNDVSGPVLKEYVLVFNDNISDPIICGHVIIMNNHVYLYYLYDGNNHYYNFIGFLDRKGKVIFV